MPVDKQKNINMLRVCAACLLLILHLSCIQNPDNTLSIMYTGNMGVLIKAGETQILIDGLHLKYEDDYLEPSQPLLDSMVFSKGKYNIDLVLVTHVHKDHFHQKPVMDFLLHNKTARFMAPKQVIDTLSKSENYSSVKGRVYVAEKTKGLKIKENTQVTPFPLIHTWPIRHKSITNMAHAIHIAGKKLVHVGDAETDGLVYKTNLFKNKRYDVAILPMWFLGKNSAVQTKRYIDAKRVVAPHLSPKKKDHSRLLENAGKNHIDAVFFDTLYQLLEI